MVPPDVKCRRGFFYQETVFHCILFTNKKIRIAGSKETSVHMRNKRRVIEILELIAGSVLPIIFWVSIIFGFDLPYIAVLTIIAAVIHELGHYIAIAVLSDAPAPIHGHSSGFRIKRTGRLSYKKEIVILLAGPLINLSVFLILIPFGNSLFGYMKIFGYVNLITCLSNLLPFEGYDGYNALRELFGYIGKESLERRLENASFVIGVGITFIALYLIDRFSEGYWIFGLFFFATVSKLAKFGKYAIFEQ